MHPVTVGRLHDHIIRFFCGCGILQQRLMLVADIAGKYDLLRIAVLCQPDFDAGRPQQMSDIRETDLHALAHFYDRIVMTGNQSADHAVRILHGIQRFHHCIVGRTFCLAVLPLCLSTLDMRTVT